MICVIYTSLFYLDYLDYVPGLRAWITCLDLRVLIQQQLNCNKFHKAGHFVQWCIWKGNEPRILWLNVVLLLNSGLSAVPMGKVAMVI